MLTLLSILLVSYLLGSIPTGIIAGKVLKRIDIRDYGSGNAGFTNAYRVLGLAPALSVLAVDLAKGMVAVLVVTKIMIDVPVLGMDVLRILAGVFAILGHIWTVFAGFRGGKGVGTAAGVLVALAPTEIALAVAVWCVVTFSTRYVSLGSLSAAVVLPLVLFVEKVVLSKAVSDELLIFTSLLAGLIFFTHRSNISRLLRGQENKLTRLSKAD
ncbi:MAG TPA: glycerol-3-phosphate 1-O-acyltransferase PlsY [Candidatus Latescibacteria bacterium]|nr:glycerol-3-phosphate 1-O-acyltransferase PlsY [Candidatus Latescibacterota bacterium]